MFTSSIRFFAVCAVVAVVCARPQQIQDDSSSTTPATIIKQVDVSNPDGSYNNSYETSNGIKVENSGYMKTIVVPRSVDEDGKALEEHEEVVLVQSGSYTYSDPEGNIITLKYIADENGFQPQGDHLPVAPEPVAPSGQPQQ
ncbi:endocuticle structural glycoprotein SgAbd-4 [Episyrphus balteatus]|uniref:endocuticle structural glycoprotein SgAbd-4 n=1 Tax=Episyrphus balteatus TaxID=286459 RepID=UPI0024863A1A|nr:endocuticle structural glycoprotein SgAbd-4 [Episyrphus balteatus]